jgi:hypothetical protein
MSGQVVIGIVFNKGVGMMVFSITLLIINKIESGTVSEMVFGRMTGMVTGVMLAGI